MAQATTGALIRIATNCPPASDTDSQLKKMWNSTTNNRLPPVLLYSQANTTDAKVNETHCAEMAKRYQNIGKRYLEPARAFFAALRPVNPPATVVYPFGGGDLLSALATYPDATDITTISLEHGGDPTRLAKMDKKATLRTALSNYRAAVSGLLSLHDSTSENMRKLEVGGIPGLVLAGPGQRSGTRDPAGEG